MLLYTKSSKRMLVIEDIKTKLKFYIPDKYMASFITGLSVDQGLFILKYD